jgi:hypothetical protein
MPEAFGPEVAVKTLVSVLSIVIVAALTGAWAAVKYLAPALAARYQLSFREAIAWGIVVALFAVVIVLSVVIASLQRPKGGSLTTTLHSGTKPSLTLTHHGRDTTYRVDGRIVNLVDGTQNPQPAPFRAELHVGGIKGEFDALLKDAEWANIVFGSIEPIYGPGSVDRIILGHALVIRRGKLGQHTPVPNTGAIVELTVQSKPPLSDPIPPKQYRVVRNGTTVNVTEEPVNASVNANT